jgi:homoserine/homoserine lactone efflux protein
MPLLQATSLAAVLVGSKHAFGLITWVGAAYTVWLGVGTFMSSGTALSISANSAAAPARMFIRGFVLQISKPGLLIYFVAFLPQFILPARGVVRQVAILGITSIGVEFVVLSLYGLVVAQLGKFAVEPRFVKLANRLAGLMLVLAAVALARSRL